MYNPTLEDSYVKDNYTLEGEPFPLEIYDTAGQVSINITTQGAQWPILMINLCQDEYVGFRDGYYRDSDGFIFVYSVTDKWVNTLGHFGYWERPQQSAF